MSKTLMAYATRYGATAETATTIADVLRDKYSLTVDIIDLRKDRSVDLDQYQNIILGVSVAKFRWARAGVNFLKNDLSDKKFFVFVSSGTAGAAAEKNDMEEYEKRQKKYIDDVLAKYNIQPVGRKAFGGRMQFGKEVTDNRNWDVIKAWAEEVGKLITS